MGPCDIPYCVSEPIMLEKNARKSAASFGGVPAAIATDKKAAYIALTCAMLLAKK